MDKEPYESMKMEIILFNVEDVITASGGRDDGDPDLGGIQELLHKEEI